MKLLKDILYKVSIESVRGRTDIPVKEVVFDSRNISEQSVFVAVSGSAVDGHQFIESAVSQGAAAVICEEFPSKTKEEITYVKVADSKQALAHLASNFYDRPSENLKLIGITGTNGKPLLLHYYIICFYRPVIK